MILEETIPVGFILLLLGLLGAGVLAVVAHALFKQSKHSRLTSARKDYYR